MSADNNLEYDIPVFRTLPEILRDSDDIVNEKDDLHDISVEKLYQLETFESNEKKRKNRIYFIILFFAIVLLVYLIRISIF
jgi:hypothetical protein